MGLYFHSKGVKRMPLDVLAQFGLTTSYTSIQKNIKKLSEDAIASIAITGSSQDAVTAYDNFEQVEGVQEQCLDDNQVMHSVTMDGVMRGSCIPTGELAQGMLNPQVKLTVDDVMWANGNMVDDTERLISHHFITEAVATVFPESIRIIFLTRSGRILVSSTLETVGNRKLWTANWVWSTKNATTGRPLHPINDNIMEISESREGFSQFAAISQMFTLFAPSVLRNGDCHWIPQDPSIAQVVSNIRSLSVRRQKE
ncbi:MAG: hypothetical protein M1839_008395 [Geoglossum umbratile]|nr:MAG: hypothetical protein M1839_008395 [Geoglossum umbratile]